jgi:predicted RNA-binding Zn-ribbon protein involved in translation (DUF1610 family)
MSHIELHCIGESVTFFAMTEQPLCPGCGNEMIARGSQALAGDYVYECRDCHVSYVTQESVRLTQRLTQRQTAR